MNADGGAQDSEVCEHDIIFDLPYTGAYQGGSWGASEIT